MAVDKSLWRVIPHTLIANECFFMRPGAHGAGRYPHLPLTAEFRHVQAGLPVRLQGIQVAGIYLDDARAGFPGNVQVRRVKHFHNGVHAVSLRLLPENAERPCVRRQTHNEQQRGSRRRSRLHHLKLMKNEILAEERKPGAAHAFQIADAAAEKLFFRQHGDAGGSRRSVLFSHFLRFQPGGDDAARRRGLLELRNDRHRLAVRRFRNGFQEIRPAPLPRARQFPA